MGTGREKNEWAENDRRKENVRRRVHIQVRLNEKRKGGTKSAGKESRLVGWSSPPPN